MRYITETIFTIGIIVLFIALIVVYFIYFRKKPKPKPFQCTDNKSCSDHGVCKNGVCDCDEYWTGKDCSVFVSDPYVDPKKCLQYPKKCETNDDCKVCEKTVEFECKESLNVIGVKGKHCLPVKPEKECDINNGGMWVWSGWQNIEGMGWTCECQYPNAFGGPGCKDRFICKDGILKGNDPNPFKRTCECKDIQCKGSTDCKYGPCVQDVCIGQKTGIGGDGVTPQCVIDGCYPNGQWDGTKCKCGPGYISSDYFCRSCDCETPCKSNMDCISNKCVKGVCIEQKTQVDPQNPNQVICVKDTCPTGKRWQYDITDCLKGECVSANIPSQIEANTIKLDSLDKKGWTVIWEPPKFGTTPFTYFVFLEKNNKTYPTKGPSFSLSNILLHLKRGDRLRIAVYTQNKFGDGTPTFVYITLPFYDLTASNLSINYGSPNNNSSSNNSSNNNSARCSLSNICLMFELNKQDTINHRISTLMDFEGIMYKSSTLQTNGVKTWANNFFPKGSTTPPFISRGDILDFTVSIIQNIGPSFVAQQTIMIPLDDPTACIPKTLFDIIAVMDSSKYLIYNPFDVSSKIKLGYVKESFAKLNQWKLFNGYLLFAPQSQQHSLLNYVDGEIKAVKTDDIPKTHNFLVYDCNNNTVHDEKKTILLGYTGSNVASVSKYTIDPNLDERFIITT